jgi:hypothetical protein
VQAQSRLAVSVLAPVPEESAVTIPEIPGPGKRAPSAGHEQLRAAGPTVPGWDLVRRKGQCRLRCRHCVWCNDKPLGVCSGLRVRAPRSLLRLHTHFTMPASP